MTHFSVIIPLYNKANYVKSCLDSVLRQTHRDFEVIIVNDGSTDGSEKIVDEFKDSRIRLIHQENKGASAARNLGVQKAKNEWIALLDADDYWYPDHLQSIQETIQLLPEANVICTNYEILLEHKFLKYPTYSICIKERPFYVKNYFEASYIDPLAWTSALGFTRKIFNVVGGFDETIKSGQDVDLMVKFGLKTHIAFHPKVTMRYHRISENNLSDFTGLREKLSYINNHLQEEKKNNALKKYMDINRFSLAIQAKMKGDVTLANELIAIIQPKLLNKKQKILINTPGFVLRLLKQFQTQLIRRKIYRSPYI